MGAVTERRWALSGSALGLGLAVWAALAWAPLPDQRLRSDWSSALLSSQGRLLRLTLNEGGRYRVKLGLDEVSAALQDGFLDYEDRWFYWHLGVNPVAVLRALRLNWGAGRVRSGASTITMQVARMLERRPRTMGAKLLEAFRALQLEARYSKREILELYLNSVPMGGNVEGVGAAALLYFGKPPSQLSLGEAALLVSLPRSPNARRPDRDAKRAKAGRDEVLTRLLAPGAALEAELARPVPVGRLLNPDLAPHWTQRLAAQARRDPGIRVTTLDDHLQAQAERALANAARTLQGMGVHNGAIVIVENEGAKLRAYVGSPDIDAPREGQVNGAAILRSPGSSLKPLLFGLALDAGLLSPQSVLFDIPRDYGGYRPANFLGSFAGPVPAQEALTRSLNAPAVWLEARLRQHPDGGLQALLKRAGLSSRGRLERDPGLSVVLGALPLSLEELAGLYTGLAQGGRWRPLRHFEDRPGDPAELRLLSEEASFVVADMLSNGRRPDLPNAWEYSAGRSRVAFKTGTSFGYRDAWCVAYDARYTVAVWLGNANAQGAAGLKSADTAAPLALEVFNAINRGQDHWFQAPASLQRRSVCADSGAPPQADCPTRVEEWYLPSTSPYQPCEVHRAVWVRKRDGRRVAADCMPGSADAYQRRVLTLWPPDVTRYLRTHRARFDSVPPPAPECPSLAELAGPRIISPQAGGRYEAGAVDLADQGLALSAHASADAQRLLWSINGFWVGESEPDKAFYWKPTPGDHQVEVLDSQGRHHSVRFQVL